MIDLEGFKALLRAGAASVADSPVGAYRDALDAAAVSSFFDPEELALRLDPTERAKALVRLERHCMTFVQGGRSLWLLAVSRRRERLVAMAASGSLLAAVRERRIGPDNATTRAVRHYVEAGARPVAEQTAEELAGSEQAVGWLRDILSGLPDEAEIGAALARNDLLSPLLELAGPESAFAGRERELAQLKAFVGSWRPGLPPAARTLGISGLGGSGKSALAARFLLGIGGPGGGARVPFAYLDLDRSTLAPDDPGALALEIMRQLAVQVEGDTSPFAEAKDLMRSSYVASASDAAEEAFALLEASGGGHDPRTDRIMATLTAAISKAGLGGAPIVVVLDALEEAEHRSPPGMAVLSYFVDRLLEAVPTVLLLLCGRGSRLPTDPGSTIALAELDRAAAIALLAGRGLPAAVAEEIQAKIGGLPFALRLAAGIAQEEGAAFLEGLSRVGGTAASVAERLYERVLGHVADPVVRGMLVAGIPLRRITPAVVCEVMAPASGVVVDADEAERLYSELRGQAALLVDEGSHLRSRQDVRAVARTAGPVKGKAQDSELHARAAAFWAKSYASTGDMADLADEIYHRIAGGAPLGEVLPLWKPGAAPHLRTAFEDLTPPASGVLALLLGDVRRAEVSGLDEGEAASYAVAAASQLLREEHPAEALEIIRGARGAPGGFPEAALLEAEALERLLRWREASSVLKAALADAPDRPGVTRALCSLMFRLGDHADCATLSARALKGGGTGQPGADLDIALAWLASTRLPGGGDGGAVATGMALSALRAIEAAGDRASPQSLRRLALLVGETAPLAVETFLRQVGLPDASSAEKAVLAQALAAWDRRSSGRRGEQPGALARLAGLPRREADVDRAWTRYIDAATHAEVSELLSRLLDSRPLQGEDAAEFARLIRFRQPEWRSAAIQAVAPAFRTAAQLADLARELSGDGAMELPPVTAAVLVRWADSEGLLPQLMRCALARGGGAELSLVSEAMERWMEACDGSRAERQSDQVPAKRPDAPGVPLFDLMKRYYEMPFYERARLGRELKLVDGSECVGDASALSRLILSRAQERGNLSSLAERMGMATLGTV